MKTAIGQVDKMAAAMVVARDAISDAQDSFVETPFISANIWAGVAELHIDDNVYDAIVGKEDETISESALGNLHHRARWNGVWLVCVKEVAK